MPRIKAKGAEINGENEIIANPTNIVFCRDFRDSKKVMQCVKIFIVEIFNKSPPILRILEIQNSYTLLL